MLKRLLDILVASVLLLLTWPLQFIALLAIYMEDKEWPIFSQPRAAKGGGYFQIYKMRTMVSDADKHGVDVTSSDQRVTRIGSLLRRCKLDELPQLWNVLTGDMSLVGPRPQIKRYVDLYTPAETGLLSVRPGVTDFSSIVFSDQAEILEGFADPNAAYLELIRPWKSRLGLFYAANSNVLVDVALIALTALAVISRPHALRGVAWLLEKLHAPKELVAISLRQTPLVPSASPDQDEYARY